MSLNSSNINSANCDTLAILVAGHLREILQGPVDAVSMSWLEELADALIDCLKTPDIAPSGNSRTSHDPDHIVRDTELLQLQADLISLLDELVMRIDWNLGIESLLALADLRLARWQLLTARRKRGRPTSLQEGEDPRTGTRVQFVRAETRLRSSSETVMPDPGNQSPVFYSGPRLRGTRSRRRPDAAVPAVISNRGTADRSDSAGGAATQSSKDKDVSRNRQPETRTSSVFEAAWNAARSDAAMVENRSGVQAGEMAFRDWYRKQWWGFLRERHFEHVLGDVYWSEFGESSFGSARSLRECDDIVATDVLELYGDGFENLDVLDWAGRTGRPIPRVLECLLLININDARFEPVFN